MLHVTNGAIAVALLRDAGMEGEIVPWDDVLHEGPVPAGLGAAALRARRAAFLASCGWGALDSIERTLAGRDRAIERASSHDEIVLWFEHDLYDQLQLLQILEVLPDGLSPPVTQPPVAGFLGHLSIDQIGPLFARRRPVTGAERGAARDAWAAFRADDPRQVLHVLPRVEALPHLAPALQRHLEQFPSRNTGLSRTERQALTAVVQGTRRMRDVFRLTHLEQEDAVFMGDAAFLLHVGALTRGPRPLLTIDGDSDSPSGNRTLELSSTVSITHDGERVLTGKADRIAICGIDRWLGGVQLLGYGPVWRWNMGTMVLH
jgi:hypothetical protein